MLKCNVKRSERAFFIFKAVWTAVLFLCCCAGAAAAFENAENVTTAAGSIELKPIAVIDSRIADPAEEAYSPVKSQEPFTVKITGAESKQSNPASASDIIKFSSPNVFVGVTNRKLKKIFNFRGSNISLSLDGMLMLDGSSNYSSVRMDERMLETINPEIIESVELIKDSTSLIYGPATTGLFMIKTRKPSEKKNRIVLEHGSFGHVNTRFSSGAPLNERSAYYLSLSHRASTGPDNTNADEYYKNIFFKYFYDFNKDDSMVLTLSRDRSMYQTPLDRPDYSQLNPVFVNMTSRLNLNMNAARSFDPMSASLASLDYHKKWNTRHSTDFSVSRAENRNDFHNPRGILPAPTGHIDGHSVYETLTDMAARHVIKAGPKTTVRTGYILSHYYNPTGKFWWEFMNNEDKNHSLYLQAEHLINSTTTFDIGVRRDRRYIVNEQRARFKVGQLYKGISGQWEPARLNYSAGLTFRPDSRNVFSIRYGEFTITAPERFSSFTGAELSDEKDRSVNLAYEREFRLAKRPASVSVNLFRTDMKNALIEDSRTRYADAPLNTTVMRIFLNQSTVTEGFETGLKIEPANKLSLYLGAGKMKFTPDITTKPRTSYNFNVSYDAGRGVDLSLIGRYMGGFKSSVSLVTGKDAAGKNVEKNFEYNLGDFWDIGMNISKKIDPRDPDSDRIYLTVRNLLDKKYETEALAPDFGRSAIIGYEMNFR